jgi:two-component system chemotaxis response regulator CheB
VRAAGHDGAATRFDVVALVASLGGLSALSEVLGGLPEGFPAHVVAVQHGRGNGDPNRLARLLDRRTPLAVRTAGQGAPVEGRGVSVVPHGQLAEIDHRRRIRLTPAGAAGDRHAGDALLSSLARTAGPRAIGVVLTGMLHDGAEGARALKRRGGRLLVQDPATAQAPGMPASTIATGCVDFVLPLPRIAPALIALTMAPGGAELFAVPTPSWASLGA